MDKVLLRDGFRRRLRDLTTVRKRQESQKIAEQLSSFIEEQSGVWSLFSPLPDEPDLTEPLFHCSSVTWVFPKIEEGKSLSFFKIDSLDDLVENPWGLAEPAPRKSHRVLANEIDGYIIPALAYDYCGVRLGRGGGYYDKTLANQKGQKVGVVFEHGLTQESLPREDHDQIVDIVVSANKWIRIFEE